MMKKLLCAAAVLCAGLPFMATSAEAASGTERFHFVFTGDPHTGAIGRVSASGVVNGSGTDRNVGSQPNPDGTTTDLDLITLPRGTITLRDTDTFTDFRLDPVSCVARVNVTGVYDVVAATGAYSGASGSGTFSGKAVIRFDRANGGCSEEPRSFFADITASGPLSIP